MITVRDLRNMLEDAVDSGVLTSDSEVRYIDRDRNDCSFELKWRSIRPGLDKHGVPVDRRYGNGALFLAQESRLRHAPEQLLLAFDW